MYLHSLCFTTWVSNPYMRLHYSHVPTFTEFYCMGSIPCVGDLFELRDYPNHYITTFTFTAFHCMGFNSLHGSPPLPCTYIHYMDSIPCVDDLFALRTLSPPLCTCIHCISLACVAIPCMGPQHSHVPTFTAFTVWVQFTMWLPLKV